MGNHVNAKGFLIAAAIGTIIGGATALLSAPKAGRKLRQDLYDTYSDLADTMQDTTSQWMGKSKNRNGFTNRAKCLVNDIKEGAKDLLAYEEEAEEQYHHRELIIGTLAGGIFGVLAGLLVAPGAGNELRKKIADKYEDLTESGQGYTRKYGQIRSQGKGWLNYAKDILDEITGQVQSNAEEFKEKAKHVAGSSNIEDIAQWASLGARVWNTIRNRNRSYSNR